MADDFETVNLLVDAGQAKPGGSINPTLGPLGINIGKVLADINKATKDFTGMQVPVGVTVNKTTKDYTLSVGLPPTSALIKNKLGLAKGSGQSRHEVIADASITQMMEVAYAKRTDLLAASIQAATKEVIGTSVCMGITVEGLDPRDAQKNISKGDYSKQFNSFLKNNPYN